MKARNQILDYLSRAEGASRLTDVSEATGVPRSTCAENLRALLREGRVEAIDLDGAKIYRLTGGVAVPKRREAEPRTDVSNNVGLLDEYLDARERLEIALRDVDHWRGEVDRLEADLRAAL